MTKHRRTCVVYGCHSSAIFNPEMSFFTLPADPERFHAWLKLIDREDLSNKSPGNYHVCEIHFEQECIMMNSNRKLLKKNAIPKLNLPFRFKEDKETQIDVITRPVHTQTDKNCQRRSINTQTPLYLLRGNLPKRKLSDVLSECNKRIKMGRTTQNDKDVFLTICENFLSHDLAQLVKTQLKYKFHLTENNYTVDYKAFFLNLFYTCPQAYRLLRESLSLPSVHKLGCLCTPITSEINYDLMRILKTKIEHMTNMERNCSLIIYTVSIKSQLFYNIREDKIYGFHEIDGVQTTEPAKYVLMVMIRGIFENWEQPIAYALLKRKNYKRVSTWIDKIIEKLFEIGLNIRTVISGIGADSSHIANKISIDKPYFSVNNKNIYWIFDPPHLMQLLCNDLIQYDFHFQGLVAKWSDIMLYYEFDRRKSHKLSPELTDMHVKPENFEKKETKYATQVLSYSVAAGLSAYVDFGLIDQTARGTAKLIMMMSNLFDILNSSKQYPERVYKKAFSCDGTQISFLNEMLVFLNSLKLFNPIDGYDVTSTAKFIEGFQITINSLLLLFANLTKEGHSCLYTRRLNRDCIKNVFNKITTKNGKTTRPMCWQLISTFRKQFRSSIMKSPKRDHSRDDVEHVLLHIEKFYMEKSGIGQEQPTSAICSDIQMKLQVLENMPPITSADYSSLTLPEKNSLLYISNFLLKTCSEHHKNCEVMSLYIQSNDAAQNDHSNDNIDSLLMIDFILFVEKMEQILNNYLKNEYINSNIATELLRSMEGLSFSAPCECFPLNYVKKLYIRLRIYHTIKSNNRVFKKCWKRKHFSIPDL